MGLHDHQRRHLLPGGDYGFAWTPHETYAFLLVDGNPTADITVLQDVKKLVGVMKNGIFHREPAIPRPGDDVRPMTELRPAGEDALVRP